MVGGARRQSDGISGKRAILYILDNPWLLLEKLNREQFHVRVATQQPLGISSGGFQDAANAASIFSRKYLIPTRYHLRIYKKGFSNSGEKHWSDKIFSYIHYFEKSRYFNKISVSTPQCLL